MELKDDKIIEEINEINIDVENKENSNPSFVSSLELNE